MMTASARKYRSKANRLMRLYSLWHETNSGEIRREVMKVLREVLAVNPDFNIRQEFQKAF